MIILALTVIMPGNQLGMKIGNPVTWQEGAARPQANGGTSGPPAPAPVQSRPIVTPQTTSSGGGTLSSHMTHPIAGLSPYQNKYV